MHPLNGKNITTDGGIISSLLIIDSGRKKSIFLSWVSKQF